MISLSWGRVSKFGSQTAKGTQVDGGACNHAADAAPMLSTIRGGRTARAAEGKGLPAVFDRLVKSFDHDPMLRSYERYAVRMGGATNHWMGATGLLSAFVTGPRKREHTFHGRHPSPRD